MTTPACSRCGTTTGQHSIECLQAMALAWAMGVEECPRVGPVRVEDDRAALRAEISQLTLTQRGLEQATAELARVRAQLAQAETENASLRALVESADQERVAHRLREWNAVPPVTQLPPGYYDGRVSDARLAEIEREVAELNASERLDVVVHDELNATVQPKEAAPEPEARPDETNWPKLVRSVRAKRKWSQEELASHLKVARSAIGFWEHGKYTPAPETQAALRALAGPVPATATERREAGRLYPSEQQRKARIGIPGAWTKPETVAAMDAIRRWVEENVVAVEGGTRTDDKGRAWPTYVTGVEVTEAYEASGAGPVAKFTQREVGVSLSKRFAKKQGPSHGGGKPMVYLGAALRVAAPAQEEEAPGEEVPAQPTPLDHKAQTEEFRALMADARKRAGRVDEIPAVGVEIPHGPDELATKLAQLKHFGIGGVGGVSKAAASAAVADLHPTGREVWKWAPPEGPSGPADADLDATAYQLLVRCMDGLPAEYGFDYKEDVLATAGFVEEDVVAALRSPQRVEIRPETWDREKRYPVLGFHRGDVTVILGMRTPTKPRVIAAYWSSLLTNDTYRVGRHGGGGAKKSTGLPTSPGVSIARLRERGCEIPEPVDEKPVEVTYKGQGLGKIMTARTTTKITVQADYQRTLRKMQAIDRREEAKAG